MSAAEGIEPSALRLIAQRLTTEQSVCAASRRFAKVTVE